MQASHPRFPVELCDIIIDNLEEDLDSDSTKDTASLRACLFVSRSFRYRARPILFKTIQIDDVTDTAQNRTPKSINRRFRLLLELVDPGLANSMDVVDGSMSPSSSGFSSGILPYIREVHVSFNDKYHGSLYTAPNKGSPSCVYRLQSLRYVIAFIKMLTTGTPQAACALRLLKIISFNRDQFKESNWARLAPSIRSSLLDLCRVSTLRTIHLDFVVNLPRDILRGTMIDRLVLGYVHMYRYIWYYEADIDVELFPEYDNLAARTKSALAQLPLPDLKHVVINGLDFYDIIESKEFNILYPTSPKSPCLSLKRMEHAIQQAYKINHTLELLGRKFPNLESVWLKCAHSTRSHSGIPFWDAVRDSDIQSTLPCLKTLGIQISPGDSTGTASVSHNMIEDGSPCATSSMTLIGSPPGTWMIYDVRSRMWLNPSDLMRSST